MNIDDIGYIGRWIDDGIIPTFNELASMASILELVPDEFDYDFDFVLDIACARLNMERDDLQDKILAVFFQGEDDEM
jgi:hypothetical protein